MAQKRLITLTTDFGLNDHYVGTMKGVILSVHPEAQIVDICHSVQSFDVLDGALAIAQAYHYFPSDTIHVVVVDPGVGGQRRPILVTTGRDVFIAPDNGVLSLVYEREERLSVRHITSEHYFLQPVSATFHGRGVFARVAGYVSKGVEAVKFGDEIADFVRFAAPKPKVINERMLRGVVLRVDKFGNIITNITPAEAPTLFREPTPPFKIMVGSTEVGRMHRAYADGAAGEPFGILGSMGFLEIAMNRGSAAQMLGAQKGTEIGIIMEQARGSAG